MCEELGNLKLGVVPDWVEGRGGQLAATSHVSLCLILASIRVLTPAKAGRHGVYVCCRTEPDTSMAFSV
jgi:hypothetical protein